ncbi:hypothetical protein CROQUDRAFT_654305 [Cronartium quercuum f. sp. fusiforme G11]|uniref:Uncharacterized protein n=1 Tax=Cronartium quercuum f. sp. fusiforme G11 TaxID=708437 RepID=A0A9P6NKY3_9BASI|nr:hypothetical protein CROQUDRAFT_654305 [Cronartium quercuum f. sp. fusiforme G11]
MPSAPVSNNFNMDGLNGTSKQTEMSQPENSQQLEDPPSHNTTVCLAFECFAEAAGLPFEHCKTALKICEVIHLTSSSIQMYSHLMHLILDLYLDDWTSGRVCCTNVPHCPFEEWNFKHCECRESKHGNIYVWPMVV